MRCFILTALFCARLAFASGENNNVDEASNAYRVTCDKIQGKISEQSRLIRPSSLAYSAGIRHWMTSSTQQAACVVEVGSTTDTAAVMKIIAETRTPFAIKSGGHASNPGFSSTLGVQITLSRLARVSMSRDKSTVDVGMGNTWIDVYKALDGSGYNVVGGRVPGPGTGGFTLGGGYSWLTNEHGLTCDTVERFTMVLPNGTTTYASAEKQTDLFFALKGGLNRFGVVTETRYRLVPQPETVYAGLSLYSAKNLPALFKATEAFQNGGRDPKAQVILTINHALGTSEALLLSFYNGPESEGRKAFAPFANTKPSFSGIKERSFLDFEKSVPANVEAGSRGAFHTLSTSRLTLGLMKAALNESEFYGKGALVDGGVFFSYDIEPFDKSYGQKATHSAFPHGKSQLPFNLYWAWKSQKEDDYWRTRIKRSAEHLTQVAKEEGIYTEDDELYLYPNYALADTPLELMYGRENVARLRKIRHHIDPTRIMDLTGGFDI